jgi:hypothetical protein
MVHACISSMKNFKIPSHATIFDGQNKFCHFCQPINHNNLDLIKRLGSWEVNVMKFIEKDDHGLLAM